jgi:hypothetical protein
MKLGALGWGGHEECMANVRNFVLNFSRKPCRKKLTGRPDIDVGMLEWFLEYM